MDTGKYAAHLELLYSDTMTVKDQDTIMNADGTHDNVVSSTIKETAKCRISYRKIDTPYELDENGEPIQFEVKVICGPSVDVKAGDYVKISREDTNQVLTEFAGYAGYPAKYGTHQEIILIYKGRA